MTVRLKNTALDRTKALLHRTASKLEMEPSLAGVRIRLNSSITISDEQYNQNKAQIDQWVACGIVEVSGVQTPWKTGPNGLRLDGPTFEQWVENGYPADKYPPTGYAIKPSPGLDKFLSEQKAAEERKAADEAAARAKKLAEEQADAEAKAAAEMAKTIAKEVDKTVLETVIMPGVEAAAEKAAVQIGETVSQTPVVPTTAPPADSTTSTSETKKKDKKKLF